MGCFGVGISRLLQAILQNSCSLHDNDEHLIWPLTIAPYTVCILPLTTSQVYIASICMANGIIALIYRTFIMGPVYVADGISGCVICFQDPSDPLMLRAQILYDHLSEEVCPGHVILDDRTHLTMGARLRDSQRLGYPCTIVIGNKVKTPLE